MNPHRLNQIVEGLPRVVPWEGDPATNTFTYVGPHAIALLGHPLDAWLRPNFWADHLHPEDRDETLRIGAEARARQDDYQLEYRLVGADGRQVWVLDVVHVTRDEAGTATHVRGILIDATERRRREEQSLRWHKLDAVGRLAGGVAHDFNNLLTVVIGCSEMARVIAPDPRCEELLGEIERASSRAADLVRQLLAFGQRQMIRPRLLDLNDVLRNALEPLHGVVGPAVEVTLNLTPAPLPVRADAAQVVQMLLTLAANAHDAMSNGGRLTLETTETLRAERDLGSHTFRGGRYAVLTVADTGRGMNEAMLARVFEPYFTTKEVGKGTGLGLATVYGAVKQCGGYVYAASEPGRGTRFTIYLPAVDDPSLASSAAAEPPRGTETVVVVEEELVLREPLQRVLGRHGYTVLTAPDGHAALDLLKHHPDPVHLVIAGVGTAGVDPTSLSEQVTAARAGTRVLLLMGNLGRAADSQSGPALAKPFTPAELLGKVRQVLDAAGA